VAERSKVLVLGTSPFGGVGSNRPAANFTKFKTPQKSYERKSDSFFLENEFNRSWQDSNLRSQRESDFKSDALTARPQLLCVSALERFAECYGVEDILLDN
jgi:hypothetical protein